ncbi:HAD-IC family P-type ATPase [Flavobacteriaceae bacterium R33]|uniref:HAD-IC family P-type ATPase n=2 Tax=Poritiphilus flavus TaxID=2697053 RepID=A0A6L9ECL5_9FLAO|nr:HAD-IC family P-type ATPase [Poritiphilus flavus]
MIQKPFSLSVKILLEKMSSNAEIGLSPSEVKQRLTQYGENTVPDSMQKGKLEILKDQFLDPIIFILFFAATLALIFGDWAEGVAVCIVILITVLIGYFMELSAFRSLESLRKIGRVECSVLRRGVITRIKASQLVPGDLLLLEAGDVVAADARLIETESLAIREAQLTGESVAVEKNQQILHPETPITEQKNMVFKGTVVTRGRGKGLVVATGSETELGKIQLLGEQTERQKTPLQKELGKLGRWLIWLMLAFVLPIIVSGYLSGKELLLMIETGIALAVAAIPEGLPVVTTIALARGMIRLSKRKVIIKQMEAVEALGSTTIIATDKTGTLTEDNMTVHSIAFEGELHQGLHLQEAELFGIKADQKSMELLILNSILCNDVVLDPKRWRGDTIDLGLLRFAKKLGKNPSYIRSQFPRVMELPFDNELKLMATVNQTAEDEFTVFAKGAFENIAQHCSKILEKGQHRTFDNFEEWNGLIDELSSKGLRTLAMAYKKQTNLPAKNEILSELVFIGAIGFIDPARKDVKDLIATYNKAGIKVVMITGDHPKTAEKIAEDMGLWPDTAERRSSLTGTDLDRLDFTSKKAKEVLLNTTVFSRATPKQKLDLVNFYQRQKNIIGMFGDGINDVPALVKADIGIAMGLRGTEAAREAADVILKDDRFGAVELAIRQGRIIYEHIRQFVVYLLSCNLAEIISVGIAASFNLPSPLLPLQILFLNLVTDVFPALALGFGEGEQDVMARPPRKYKEPIMTAKLWASTVIYGISITAAILGITMFSHFELELPPEKINNMAFYTLIVAQLLNIFNMPKRHLSFFKNEVTKNPWVWGAIVLSLGITFCAYAIPVSARALSLVSIGWEELKWTILFGFSTLLLAQLMKRIGLTT